MRLFLNTTGNTTLGVGLCDRCHQKFPIDELKPDRDNKGLLVCDADNDEIDRYKLPARKPESVILRNIRTDSDLTPSLVLGEDGLPLADEYGYYTET